MPLANSEEGIRIKQINEATQFLTRLPVDVALGAACGFLLHCAYNHRLQFRRVMNERVVREGFTGISLLKLFNRMSF